MKKILFLQDYKEDQRLSMDLYADLLIKHLTSSEYGEDNPVSSYIPHMSPGMTKTKNGIRIARFISYPIQLIGKKATLFHIVDHSYAHLIHFLDPQRTIITVHDLIPYLYWKGAFEGLTRGHFHFLFKLSINALKKAKHLIAVSESTKKDLVKYLKIDPQRITVVYSGVDPIFYQYSPAEKSYARKRLFGGDEKLRILITGDQFYKNQGTSLKIFRKLFEMGYTNFELYKTGNPSEEWMKLVQSYGMESKVKHMGVLPRQEMPDLYNAVDILLFPSLYEGFGWPPLEAMACGTPAVTSNAGALPEVVGNAGPMFPAFDVEGFVTEIQELVENKDYLKKRIELGLQRAKKFNWDQTIMELIEVYNSLERNVGKHNQ